MKLAKKNFATAASAPAALEKKAASNATPRAGWQKPLQSA